MARPIKYNWDAIREAYEGGFNKDDIVKKYKITKKLLTNKIRDDKWLVKGHISDDVDGFYANTQKMAENIQKLHPQNQELVHERINTIEQDNELMKGTRQISKLLLSVIVNNRNEINLGNIKNVSGVLKDIESIANPNSSKIDIVNTNAQQNNLTIEIE